MAQFVLTITSDDPLEIASFLDRNAGFKPTTKDLTKLTEQLAPGAYEKEILDDAPPSVEAEPKRKGRPPKTTESAPETSGAPASSTESQPLTDTTSEETSPEVTLADVKALINQVVKVKPAKAVVDALTATCGTAAPGAMDAGQLAKARTVLEGLLNG